MSWEEIENGYIVARPPGKVFRQNFTEAIREVRLSVDNIEREHKAEEAKAASPSPAKVAVPVR